MSHRLCRPSPLHLLLLFMNAHWASGFKDWYFGVKKVPDFRMMAVKPAGSIKDSVIYTCSAASNESDVDIRFLINFRNLTDFCAPTTFCRSPPRVGQRTSHVLGSLSIYEAQLEFRPRRPMSGTVSCVFSTANGKQASLAQLYGFFCVYRELPPPEGDAALRRSLCNLQQGCRWEEAHCTALNHLHCAPCQDGMGFDPYYHLCYDPRQINQSCVFNHQCRLSDKRSVCVDRRCLCRSNHVVTPEGCKPVVQLGYLCGPGTVCKDQLECRDHACHCQEDDTPVNGTCIPLGKIDIKDMMVIATSTMIVFTAFTSMLCLLLRDKQEEDDDMRSERSKYSMGSLRMVPSVGPSF
ncbi:uncharacterized protein LOC135393210 [Ornithodoros turicata]|uniref:uncharacterized protein LOC135393210 n=1 Tax=Ornithodoros turicata TaxID=34597 RepID=UPI0031399464